MQHRPLILLLTIFCGCSSKHPLFSRMDSALTGISFNNKISETDSLNIFQYEYIYNGGGVAAADFNGDGLEDLVFTGNMVSSSMYLNLGNFTFKDITQTAGLTTSLWCTGVAVVDINQDHRPDLYICTVDPFSHHHSRNLLFINQGNDAHGIPGFVEQAAAAGLDDSSYNTQAVFFDYDLDGDLDMYLCVNAIHEGNRNALVGQRTDGKGASQDRLFRNDGMNAKTGLPHFSDVSREAGIQTAGWGLGVIVKDINRDGWPDVYVANDFQSNDHLYINNHDGTFTDKVASYLGHQCHNAMGVDMADCNNDALEDICVVDMLPDDNLRQKKMFGSPPNDTYERALKMGYQPQFVRNMLQLNTGLLPDSATGATAFCDIGYMAGVAATDWSWSPLWADFDNDGWRDLLITNGYVKDITDLDFTTFMNEYNIFGDPSVKRKAIEGKVRELGEVKKTNKLFMNDHHLGFAESSASSGLKQPSFSSGAVYADLDNDGDLDLVINNLNEEAFVYKNNTREANLAVPGHNYLAIRLEGNAGNNEGIGAAVTIWTSSGMQFAEHTLQRGYLSSVDNKIFFGLGSDTVIDSIRVKWLYGVSQTLTGVGANQLIVLKQSDALRAPPAQRSAGPAYFSDVGHQLGLDQFIPVENEFNDFNYQYTLPHRNSTQGPGVAVGDVNGDGRDDIYVGGASRVGGCFFLQQPRGFVKREMRSKPEQKRQEETGVLLFDADGDGDNDLYCVGGGDEFQDSTAYQDMLFINDGRGNFVSNEAALPVTTSSGSCVVGADYDGDGDIDLFVGGRIQPGRYPMGGKSYVLRNDTDKKTGKVHFTDVTAQLCQELQDPGMVTSAIWTDYNNDGWPDLLVAGEFMPLELYENLDGKKFERLNIDAFQQTQGWYNSLCPIDIDNDGDMDYIAGNLGLNSAFQASPAKPVAVRYNDYDHNGSLDAFLFRFIGDEEYPANPRNVAVEQVSGLKKRFFYYSDYGKATASDLFTDAERKGEKELTAVEMRSLLIVNMGNGRFQVSPLPRMAQTSPMLGIVALDVNHDGLLDIAAVGNSYAPESLTGRYDASMGWLLQNNGNHTFTVLPIAGTGFVVGGDARSLVKILNERGRTLVLAAQNQGPLRVFEQSDTAETVSLQPQDASVVYHLPNEKKRKEEFYYGGSYLSQSGRFSSVPPQAVKLEIFDGRQHLRKSRYLPFRSGRQHE